MKGLIKVISVLVSIVFSLFFVLFILGLITTNNGFAIYTTIGNKIYNYIEKGMVEQLIEFGAFVRSPLTLTLFDDNLFIFIGTLIFISSINIINRFYDSLKYIGSSFVISSSFMLFGLFFIDKIKVMFDSSLITILNGNIDKFSHKIYCNSIIFLFVGIIMIVLYSIIDILYENYKNKRIVEENVEIIEEK